MKNNFYYTLIFLFIGIGNSSAQSQFGNTLDFTGDRLTIGPTQINNFLPLSNYHFFNPYYYNPAMAGIEDKKQLNADWNRQYDHSFLMSYEHPISSINSAIGMHALYTSDYFTSVAHYGLAYNYGFTFDEQVKLKLGLQFSQLSISFDESLFGLTPNKKKWYNAPTMDIGVALQAKPFRFGISIQNLFPSRIISEENFVDFSNGERQLNISLANTFKLSEKWHWSLAILFRDSENQNIHDFSSYISFRETYFIGTTFRTEIDHHWISFIGVKVKEKMNLQFSFNTQKHDFEDQRFIESLVQYQF